MKVATMKRRIGKKQRRGASAVEFALVAPIAFFMIFAIIVGGLGVFRYQEVAHLARETSRYAAVRGGQYERETGKPALTEQDVKKYALSHLQLLDSDNLSVQVDWLYDDKMPLHADPDADPPGSEVLPNKITVTIEYQWFPDLYLFGPITMSSTSVMPISF